MAPPPRAIAAEGWTTAEDRTSNDKDLHKRAFGPGKALRGVVAAAPDGKGDAVRFVSTYRFKSFITKEETQRLLAVFAEVGNAPGVTDHLVFADGSGGVVVGETDDIKGLYRNVMAYNEFVDFETHIALTAEEAVPEVASVVTS